MDRRVKPGDDACHLESRRVPVRVGAEMRDVACVDCRHRQDHQHICRAELAVDHGAVPDIGSEPQIAAQQWGQRPQHRLMVDLARRHSIPTVLDAGSLHAGTELLSGRVDYLVASQTFARQISGQEDAAIAAGQLHRPGGVVVVTLGADGLVWRTDTDAGHLPAFEVDAVDTTGAGDAFHGAFAVGLSMGMSWHTLLRYASAAAALCCREFGARLGMPTHRAISELLKADPQPSTDQI